MCFQDEACLVGLFWNYPDLYGLYSVENITTKTFSNKIWGYYFGLGRYMYNRSLLVFDDINTIKYVNETKTNALFEEYGGFKTIAELMEETIDKQENLDAYYDIVKKGYLLTSLSSDKLFGSRVLEISGKYNPQIMTREQIKIYWADRLNQAIMEDDNPFEEGFLLKDVDKAIDEWNKNPDVGLPFYHSPKFTKLTNGWAYGGITICGLHSGKGKTSYTISKVVMSCIENKEKLLIIANEQSLDEWMKMTVTTIMGSETKEYVQRQRLQEGNFTPDEEKKLKDTAQWIKDNVDDDKLIRVVFMENYTISNVKQVLTRYAHRGYRRVIIDTAKPGDDSLGKERWQRFAEDFDQLYKIVRPNGGGLNLALWVNVQLSDTSANNRFLTEYSIGDSKKIKNTASVLWLGRPIRDDEYGDGNKSLIVYKWSRAFNDEVIREEFTLDREDDKGNKNIYYLFFMAKNRRGQSNDTGADVLVYKWIPQLNIWAEIGWTRVIRDNNFS